VRKQPSLLKEMVEAQKREQVGRSIDLSKPF
jgi:hypothetical protein